MNYLIRKIDNGLRSLARAYPHNPVAMSLIYLGMNACKMSRKKHAGAVLETLYKLERKEVIHRGNHAWAIVVIARGEDAYLPDWIDFHREQGVSQFYFYDNAVNDEDADRTFRLLKRYISDEKTLSYIRWPDVGGCRVGCIRNSDRSINTIQELAYLDFKNRFGRDTQYYIKLDVDEFLFHQGAGRLSDLPPFRGTISIKGYNFGSSGHDEKSPGPVWERFIWRDESVNHVKSLSRTRDVYEFFNAHLAFDKPGIYFGLRASRQVALRDLIRSTLKLHHYKLKSKEEFIAQRVKTVGYLKGDYSLEDFIKLDGPMNAVRDDTLARFKVRVDGAPGRD